MKFKIAIASAILILLAFSGAYAANNTDGGATAANSPADPVHGIISAIPEVVNVTGSKAKFSEYRDLTGGGGLFSNINLGYDSGNYWLELNASDIGYKDQNEQLEGGIYDKFRAGLFFNQILHNVTFDAKSPYANVGSANLVSGTGTWSNANLPANPGAWPGTFNYFTRRDQVGADVKIDMLKPFYATFSVFNEHKSGILPMGGADSFSSFIEIPAPIDYVTQDYMTEIGYQARPLFAALNFQYSNFTDRNEDITFQVPFGSFLTDTLSMPSDNNYYKVGLKTSLELPCYSHFNVNLGRSSYTSHADLVQPSSANIVFGSQLSPASSAFIKSLSSPVFDGKRDVYNADITLTSSPVSFLDGRLFYKYYDSTNNSEDLIVTTGAGTTSTPLVFDYNKNTYGAKLGFKLPESFHLETDYSYVQTKRPGVEALPSTNDNIYYAELRWDKLDFLTPRVSYEFLNRGSQGMLTGTAAGNIAPSGGLAEFLRLFNAADQHRNTFKTDVDISPFDRLDVDVAYQYIMADYTDTVTGLRSSRTDEWDFNGHYKVAEIAKINGYFDIDNISSDQAATASPSSDFTPSGPGSANPATATGSATNFNYIQHVKDNEYEYGAGAEIYVIPGKLTCNVRYDYVNSYGYNDITIFSQAYLNSLNGGAGADESNIDPVFDTYKKSSVNVNLKYDFSRHLSLAGGVAFDHFQYNDASVDNYQYVYYSNTTKSTSATDYDTGAYANQSYNANVEYLMVAYRF